MRVLVCGDRDWTNENMIRYVLEKLGATHVIHGGCRGADQAAGRMADELGIPVTWLAANWTKYGKAAGPIRNEALLTEDPDLVVAFHNNLARSRGTKDMVMRASEGGVPVLLLPNCAGAVMAIFGGTHGQ